MVEHRSPLARFRTVLAAAMLLPGLTILLGGLGTPASAAPVGSPDAVVGYGSAAGVAGDQTGLPGPVTGIAADPAGNGYWTTNAAGEVLAQGGAPNLGSLTIALNAPIIGIAANPTGEGYWLVGADGGIFSFGDAGFHGSTGNLVLNQPVVGMASTPNGLGYWLVAADGGVFSFGDAGFHGSMGGIPLVQPVVGMTASSDGGGYRMVAADGGIFSFGDAPFYGSGSGAPLTAPVVGMAVRPGGYWIAYGTTAPLTTVLGQEQVLAGLGYGPLSWTPFGFQWRWAPPPTLAALWAPGADTVIAQGEIMSFENQVGLTTDGAISNGEIAALAAAASDPYGPARNPNGYAYALANEGSPETLTVWWDGGVVVQTLANTGGPGTPTQMGSFPVYLRYRYQVMMGINPDGTHYADPVQFVSYFNGGDALHYFPRASYGFPQSLGCVELPIGAAGAVWPYTVIGTIVTVN